MARKIARTVRDMVGAEKSPITHDFVRGISDYGGIELNDIHCSPALKRGGVRPARKCKSCESSAMPGRYHCKVCRDKVINRRAARIRTRKYLRDSILSFNDHKCELCGVLGKDRRIECHHLDYDDPMKVQWLCIYCHHEVHHGSKT